MAVEQPGHIGLGGIIADEKLLPEAIEVFQLHPQGHARLDAVIGADGVMLSLDFPAGTDVAMQPGVFFSGDPTAARRPLSPLIAGKLGLGHPTEFLPPHLPGTQLLHLVRRVPAVAELHVAQQAADLLVVRVGPNHLQDQSVGQGPLMLVNRRPGQVVERCGLGLPQFEKLILPLDRLWLCVGGQLGRPRLARQHREIHLVWVVRPEDIPGFFRLGRQPLLLAPGGQFRHVGRIVALQLLGFGGDVLGPRGPRANHHPRGRREQNDLSPVARPGAVDGVHSFHSVKYCSLPNIQCTMRRQAAACILPQFSVERGA